MMPTGGSGLSVHFVHALLRARDFQNRAELDHVCDWWNKGGQGLFALIGMGGSGKTAIAHRFLSFLPDVFPQASAFASPNPQFIAPSNIFVFSFHDDPNPDSFFRHLCAFLDRGPPMSAQGRRDPSAHAMFLLKRADSCLLVLDGMESLQTDLPLSDRFGRIMDGRILELLTRVSEGALSNVSILLTSRFPLLDLEEKRASFFRSTEVGMLSLDASVRLLRASGITKATQGQLEVLARDQGCHALTLELLGTCIGTFSGGELVRFQPLPDVNESDLRSLSDLRRLFIVMQERRLARVLSRLQKELSAKDKAAFALLCRACLFRGSVSGEMLSAIFLGPDKERISGPHLFRLTPQDLFQTLGTLSNQRLLATSLRLRNQGEGDDDEPAQSTETIEPHIHPALREAVLRAFIQPNEIRGEDTVPAEWKAALGRRPELFDPPYDIPILDLLEGIVRSALVSQYSEEAWFIYWTRMGNYRHIGKQLGDYVRGERICRLFAGGVPLMSVLLREFDAAPASRRLLLPYEMQPRFFNEWGLYLSARGRLLDAARCFETHNEARVRQNNLQSASIGYQNIAEVRLLSGRLRQGLEIAKEALRFGEMAKDKSECRDAVSYCAHARTLLGKCALSLVGFRAAFDAQRKRSAMPVLIGPAGIRYAHLLKLLGRHQEALAQLSENQRLCDRIWGPENTVNPEVQLLICELCIYNMHLSDAEARYRDMYAWAEARGAKELLCRTAIVGAKIELATYRKLAEDGEDGTVCLLAARSAVDEGIRLARESGYGIFHIDLLLLRACVALHLGLVDEAIRDCSVALHEGIHPSDPMTEPILLAALDPECMYAWGIAEGHFRLGEARLLQAARYLGQPAVDPLRMEEIPEPSKGLIQEAERHFSQAMEYFRNLRDPDGDAPINMHGIETLKVLSDFQDGLLTRYPLAAEG